MSAPKRRKLSAQEVARLGLDNAPNESETEIGPSERPEPDALGSVIAGAGQGVTLGFGDELTGAVDAAFSSDEEPRGYAYGQTTPLTITKTRVGPNGKRRVVSSETRTQEQLGDDPARSLNFLERYRRERDAARDVNQRAHEENPRLYDAAEFVSGFVPQALAGPAALTPQAQAAFGAATAAGHSKADLTTGDPSEVAKAGLTTAAGASLGFGAGKLGQAVGDKIGTSRLARFLESKIAGAKDDAAAQATKVVDKGIASLEGAAGSAVQKGSRALENLGREAPNVSSELQNAATALTESGAPQELRESVFKSTLDELPKLAGRAAAAKAAFREAAEGREAAIAEKSAEILDSPFSKQIAPRLKTYLTRSIPIAVGSAVGGPLGAAAGMATGAALGAPGTALSNMIKSPGVRRLAFETMQRALVNAPERLGKYASILTTASQPIAAHAFLESKDPDYLPTLLRLADEETSTEQP